MKSQKRDKQADTRGNSRLNNGRDGVKNYLSQSRGGQQNEHKTVDENEYKRVCVRETERQANRVYEECVDSHTGRLRKRQIGQKSHQHRSDNCGKCGCNIHGIERYHAECCKHSRVDNKNVCHRKKCCQTRDNFGFGRRTHFGILEFSVPK